MIKEIWWGLYLKPQLSGFKSVDKLQQWMTRARACDKQDAPEQKKGYNCESGGAG